MHSVRCVVFDIDDTLYLERDYVFSGFEAVGHWLEKERGVLGFGENACTAFERGVRGNTFNLVLSELGVEPSPALVKEMVSVYREHEPKIALLPDALACLHALHGRVAMAAITDGPVESQRNKAQALGLETFLDPIIYTEELGAGFGKPNPRAFEIIEERTGCHSAECVYVADNPAKDFGGPNALGWRTVRVRRDGGLHASADGGACTEFEIADLDGLVMLLSANDAMERNRD